MQGAGTPHLVKVLANSKDAVADQPPVQFQLRFAGSAQKAEAAPLALQMGPGANQPRPLIGQRRQFNLELTLAGAGAGAENLQDQAGAINDLGLGLAFQVPLLHRGQGMIEDDQRDIAIRHQAGQPLHRARAEESRRVRTRQGNGFGVDHRQVDGGCQRHRLFKL